MCHAAVFIMTVLATATLGGIKLLIDSPYDVSHGNLIKWPRYAIATTRATHAVDQLVSTQFAEQLLKVRKRNPLTLTDAGQRHRPVLATHGKVHHGRHGETSLGCQTHLEPLLIT